METLDFSSRGSALGAGGQGFKSSCPDHFSANDLADEFDEQDEETAHDPAQIPVSVPPMFRKKRLYKVDENGMKRALLNRLHRADRVGLIYFILCDCPDPCIKIGLARDVDARVSALQIGCPYPLELLATLVGDVEAEKSFHRRFAKTRRAGEWFALSEELVDFVNGLHPATLTEAKRSALDKQERGR